MFGTAVRYHIEEEEDQNKLLHHRWTDVGRQLGWVQRSTVIVTSVWTASFLLGAKNATSLAAGRSFEGRKGFGVTTHCGVSWTFFLAAQYIRARFGNQLCMLGYFSARKASCKEGNLCILQWVRKCTISKWMEEHVRLRNTTAKSIPLCHREGGSRPTLDPFLPKGSSRYDVQSRVWWYFQMLAPLLKNLHFVGKLAESS